MTRWLAVLVLVSSMTFIGAMLSFVMLSLAWKPVLEPLSMIAGATFAFSGSALACCVLDKGWTTR